MNGCIVWRALLYGWAAVSSRLDYGIQQSSVKVSTAASTKNLFIGCDFENIYCNHTHTHTHTHTSSKNDPSLPPLISASLRVLPHLPVLWHVLQVALLDTKESRSHFGVGQSVAHDTSLGYKQVCSHWCIGSSHFTGDLLWHTLLGSEIQQWAGQTVPAFLRL